MTAYFSDPWLTIHEGDCRVVLREMEPESDRGVVECLRGQVQPFAFRPTCLHDAPTVPGVVLDPFAGTGTTLMVANRLSRRAIGIDLNASYLQQCLERNRQTPLGLEAS